MPDANNITVITGLSSCNYTNLDLNRTVYNLFNLYKNNLTSNVFLNVLILNYNCTSGVENYFEQLLIFTQFVSIRIQILFASIYSDYINANNYQLNGFIIDQQTYFNLSSITTNYSVILDACSSADAAYDPFCLTNSTNPVCTILSNRWNFICSSNRMNNTQLETSSVISSLTTWQLGLICGFSVLFVLVVLFLCAYFFRRYRHSKKIALSRINLYDDPHLLQKIGIPQGQAFQRARTLVQPRRSNNTAISWIHNETTSNGIRINENHLNTKASELHHQVTSVDHAKIHDPGFPLKNPRNFITPLNVSTSFSDGIIYKTTPTIVVSRSVSGKSIHDELPEDKLNESDNLSLDQSILNNSRTPLTKQYTNVSFTDENLSDEDAWMSILDVVNAELAILDEQDQIRVLM